MEEIEVLLFKKTTDADLSIGQTIVYKDTYGQYTQLAEISSIEIDNGFTYYLLNKGIGAYLAEDLKLIKK
jgi:hypothetical protein